MSGLIGHRGLLLEVPSGGGGSYPNVLSITQSELGAAATTSHLVAMPAVVSAGDLLLALFANADNRTVTTPGGWTLLNSVTSSGQRAGWYYCVAAGTEGGTTVDFVTSSTARAMAHVYRVQAGTYTGSPVSAAGVGSGSTASPDPPSLTSGFGAVPTLWVASVGSNNSNTTSGFPYADGQTNTRNATAGASFTTATSCWAKVTSVSEDPGVFTISSARACVSHTVAVRGT